MNQWIVQPVVEVLEALRYAVREVEARFGPCPETLGSVHECAERAHWAKLEHETELVGTFVPAPTVELDEVRMIQRGHDL